MPSPKPAFKCGVPGCNRSFQSHDGLKKHTSDTHRVQQQTSSRNTNNPFKCGVPGCNRSFQSHDGLKKHSSDTHRVQQQQTSSRNTNNPFKCGVPGCNRSFQSHDGLKKHTSDTHRVQQQTSSRNTNNPFKCGVPGCNHSFQSHDGLKKHTSDTHRVQQTPSRNTNNPFKCGVPGCNRSFHLHHDLTRHGADYHPKSSPVVIRAPTYPIQHQHYYLSAPQPIVPLGNPDSSHVSDHNLEHPSIFGSVYRDNSYPDDGQRMHEKPVMSSDIQDTENEPDSPTSLLEIPYIDDSLPYIDKSNICNQLVRILDDPDKYRNFLGRRDKEAQLTLNKLQAVIDLPQLDPPHKKRFMRALINLSRASSLYPECFVMNGVVATSDTPVAQGSFGVVFPGLLRGHAIAIKEIRMSVKEMEKILKDCSTEIIIWRQLHHPNILPFYGVYHLGRRPKTCLLSPWMEQGDITSFLKREPTANRVRLAVDIAQGLEYLHEHEPRIVHCDLKGVNILVTHSQRACLADFGLSKSLRDSGILKYSPSSSIRAAGTLRWTAPELLNDDGKNSQESDIFSFGRVCYEIFAGHIPFHNITAEGRLLIAIIEGQLLPRPEGLDDYMWKLILSCCEMEPAVRPTARGVLEVLRARPDLGADHRPSSDWNEGFIDQIRSLAERPDISGANVWE